MPLEMPKAEAIEDVQQKIMREPQAVSREDIDSAFQNYEREMSAYMESRTPVEQQRMREKLNEQKDKMIAELEAVKANKTSERGKALKALRMERAQMAREVSLPTKGHEESLAAYTAAESKAKEIEDYEGADWRQNKTRDTLQGYLAAMERFDQTQAAAELAKAKDVYNKSASGTFDFDKVLKYDDMTKGLGMDKYIGYLDRFKNLTDEGRGVMTGYLAISDRFLKTPDEKDSYRKYVLDILSRLQSDEKLKEKWHTLTESTKREEQRLVLETVMTPMEWKAENDKAGDIKVAPQKVEAVAPAKVETTPAVAATAAVAQASVESNNPAEGSADYKTRWNNAETVKSGFQTDQLRVSSEPTKYRDNDGNILGDIPKGTDIPMVQDDAKKIGDTVFIKVKYKEKEVWVDKAQLMVSEGALATLRAENERAEAAAAQPVPAENKPVVETVPADAPAYMKPLDSDIMKIMGNAWVMREYIDAYNTLADYRRYPSKYPNGARFEILLNNSFVGASLKYEDISGGRLIFTSDYTKQPRYFDTTEQFIIAMNNGTIAQMMQTDFMANDRIYEPYKEMIGDTDTCKTGNFKALNRNWPVYLEFDWEGKDPDIYINPLPGGKIEYAIRWNGVNYDGEDWRSGIALNMTDFVFKLKHYRDWGNRLKKMPEDAKPMEGRKERLYDDISNPYFYLRYIDRMGDVLNFRTTEQYSVMMSLDWGGGGDVLSPENPQLNIWVGTDGMIHYNLAYKDVTGVTTSGVANTPNEVIEYVIKLKQWARQNRGAK